jgi:hypothetical protein
MASAHNDLPFDPPYDQVFTGLLSFAGFSSAEETLGKLENLRQRFRCAGDKKGVDYCRRLALLGRRRAGLISRNPRVSPRKRLQKREIETWFRVWLETPEIFEDWLALRKMSEEYKDLAHPEPTGPQPENVDAPST